MSEITTTTLDCGMPLVVERLDSRKSAAVRWLVPCGSAAEAENQIGVGTLLSELMLRGAGKLDSRQLSDSLDTLGVRRSCDLQTWHLKLSATMLAARLSEALPLLASIMLEPRLPETAIDPVRNLCLQSLEALRDEPQYEVMLWLRSRHRQPPFNRTGYGEQDVLASATRDDVVALRRETFRPGGSIFAAAGDVDPDALAGQLNDLLTAFTGVADQPRPTADPARGYLPLQRDTAQVHIALACDAPAASDDEAVLERLALAVLSGGTSGRLFTEVRQKRSLCYSVGGSYRPGRDTGEATFYAGTTPDRAQETLDVVLAETARLSDGVTDREFKRAATRLKSRLVMQGESTPARATALASDLFRLGRARTLDERAAEIDAVNLDQLNAYLARRVMGPFTLVTIGPVELSPPATMQAAAAR